MPELPDVHMLGRYVDSTVIGRTIRHVHVDHRDLVLDRLSPQALGASLAGKRMVGTARWGKHLFVALHPRPHLRMHFGMTGNLVAGKLTDDRLPEHARVVFELDDRWRLVYVSQRMIGEVGVVDDPETYVREQDLGPDALRVDVNTFVDLFKGRRGSIKTALMDQHVLAGLGNVYVDEVLYQMHWHPRTRQSQLGPGDLRRLHLRIRRVLNRAIDAGADPHNMPHTWLITHRRRGRPCPRCNDTIQRIEISGRGTYYCPTCQGEPS